MSDDEKTRPDHDPGVSADSFGSQETVTMASLTKGMEFGRYRIVHRIGSGGMGTVYSAFDPTLDRTVALKVLHDKVEDADAEQRLLREAQAMARLSHPNVVTVHDAGMKDGRPYVAMEFVEGYDLRTWLRREKRDWREIVDTFVSAGDGLVAAHAAGLIHRDFKPGNVMVGNDGRVRVTDFGLARAAEAEGWAAREEATRSLAMPVADAESSSPLETPLTQAGMVLGTPAYMAPEQALEGRADHRSDQYAFCVSLYVALFGKHPLGEFSNLPEFVAQLETDDVSPPAADHGVPARIVTAIIPRKDENDGSSPESASRRQRPSSAYSATPRIGSSCAEGAKHRSRRCGTPTVEPSSRSTSPASPKILDGKRLRPWRPDSTITPTAGPLSTARLAWQLDSERNIPRPSWIGKWHVSAGACARRITCWLSLGPAAVSS
jgi:serine/threonine protein kinase